MSGLAGTRGLILVSQNLLCEWLAAMSCEGVRELEFYRRVTGEEFLGEWGERVSARRRGAKFEENLHRNNAALLRRALAPIYGLDPATMVVRNFADEVPGGASSMRAMRLYRTRNILKDLAAGRPVPHLLVQPQLRIPTGPGPRDFEHVSPDFMVLDPRVGMYVPGEEKSFIVRDGVGDPGDLNHTRRQAGAQILALRAEAAIVGLADLVVNRAVFVFATPFGLDPAPPVEEMLDAPVHAIEQAIVAVSNVRNKLSKLRAAVDSPLEMLVDELNINFQESCVGPCPFANKCRKRSQGKVRQLGDAASDLLGANTDPHRVLELALGSAPRTPEEEAIAPLLIDAVRALGYVPRSIRRLIA